MADNKKLSELSQTRGLSNNDEFIVVDKSTTSGVDASSTGRTSKIRFDDLKNQIGSQGQKGETGSPGPQGQKGETGSPGSPGRDGENGVNGRNGTDGNHGNPGEPGAKGPRGPEGEKGPQGNSITGPAGEKGPQGNSVTGQKGPQGNSITGPGGEKGQKGATGATGKPETINYASSDNWQPKPGYQSDTGTGGTFAAGTNSAAGENQVVWGNGPFGQRVKVWQSINNDTTSNFDGGWNKSINGLDKNASYMSVVYVRRVGSATNGQFYHGCGSSANQTLTLANSADGNPYFRSFSIASLPANVWCVSIGFIHANNDSSKINTSIAGCYRLDTGKKVMDGYKDFKMGTTGTQVHRTYLYYSTDPKSQLEWALPGFYEVNATAPSLPDLIGSSSGNPGPAGPKGETGSNGRINPHIDWRGDGAFGREVSNQSFKKTGSNTWSTGYGYTNMYYNGGCSLTFSPVDTATYFMFGLSSRTDRNNSNRYYNIDYGFYLMSNGTYDIRRSGSTVKGGSSYTKDTIFTVTYDNLYVRYYVNGVLKHTETTSANRTFFAYMSIHDVNEWTVSKWSFDPMGSRGANGAKGPQGNSVTGAKGPQGNSVTGVKGQKGDSQKGQKGELGASGSPWGGGTFTGDVTFDKNVNIRGNVLSGKQPRLLYRTSVSVQGGTNSTGSQWGRSNAGTKTNSYGDTANQLEKIFGKYTYQKGDKAVLVSAPTFEIGTRITQGKSNYIDYSMTNLKPTLNDSIGQITCDHPNSVGQAYSASYTYEIFRPSNL